jgi:hypothetical protein
MEIDDGTASSLLEEDGGSPLLALLLGGVSFLSIA